MRIDMSEFAERLASPTYRPLLLATSATAMVANSREPVRTRPIAWSSSTRSGRSSPDIYNLLLQVLDDVV